MADDAPASLDVSDDLTVAAVAAGCTVAFTLVLRFGLALEVPLLVRLLPLAPYFAYVVTRRLSLGPLDTARNWAALTVALTVCALGYYVVAA